MRDDRRVGSTGIGKVSDHIYDRAIGFCIAWSRIRERLVMCPRGPGEIRRSTSERASFQSYIWMRIIESSQNECLAAVHISVLAASTLQRTAPSAS